VNWFNKIKKTTEKVDNSLELKRGEIKQILIQVANDTLPDFKFLAYKNGCYTFQRIRKINDLEVYELLHIIFSIKDKNFACSIASRLNTNYIFVNNYNLGIINPHKDLKVLRHNSGILNIKDAYYFHNSKVETTTKVVKEIFEDYKKYGIVFLENQFENLKTNKILKFGFEYLNNLNIDKQTLKNEISEELAKNGFLLSKMQNYVFLNLKTELQTLNELKKNDKILIPKTALEIIELYCSK